MRHPTRCALFPALLMLLPACQVEPDPSLLFSGGDVFVVGQRASLQVTKGGEGSDLIRSSFELVAADQERFGYNHPDLALNQISPETLQFSVPPRVAVGPAMLAVSTDQGATFEGELQLNRLAAVRDLAGKVWLLALRGSGQAVQFWDVAAGLLGAGKGLVRVGAKGRLLASTVEATGELYLAWMGAQTQPSTPYTFAAGVEFHDLAVTPAGNTLVATSSGVFVAAPPTSSPPEEPQVGVTPVVPGNAVALAVDQNGLRAAALVDPGSGAGFVSLALIDLSSGAPVLLTTLYTTWPGGNDPSALSLAMTPDGAKILAVDGANNSVALFPQNVVTPIEADLPAAEQGTVAATSAPDGSEFFLANAGTANVSRLQEAGGSITFAAPIELSNVAQADSGLVVDITASTKDEVLVLLDHDVVVIYDNALKVQRLVLNDLFSDPVNGEVGGSISVQP